jgi:hypothetical protein
MADKPEMPPKREAAEPTDDARGEEAVRRLARHFLATPPQPKKAAPKSDPKRPRRGKPQER